MDEILINLHKDVLDLIIIFLMFLVCFLMGERYKIFYLLCSAVVLFLSSMTTGLLSVLCIISSFSFVGIYIYLLLNTR